MIEVIDLPFEEAKDMVTCSASEDKIENFDATFLFLIYWFLYNKESTTIRIAFKGTDLTAVNRIFLLEECSNVR